MMIKTTNRKKIKRPPDQLESIVEGWKGGTWRHKNVGKEPLGLTLLF